MDIHSTKILPICQKIQHFGLILVAFPRDPGYIVGQNCMFAFALLWRQGISGAYLQAGKSIYLMQIDIFKYQHAHELGIFFIIDQEACNLRDSCCKFEFHSDVGRSIYRKFKANLIGRLEASGIHV